VKIEKDALAQGTGIRCLEEQRLVVNEEFLATLSITPAWDLRALWQTTQTVC